MKENYLILLIEDDPGDALLIRELISDAPKGRFNIIQAGSVKDAIEALKNNYFDAILTDLGFPDSFGLDTVKRLLPYLNGMPMIVLTGLEDEKTGLDAIGLGAQDYLVKGSFNSSALYRAIRYSIERNHAQKALEDNELRFRKMAENIEDGLIIIENNELMFVNDRASEILGYHKDEIKKMRPHDMIIQENTHTINEHIQKFRDNNEVPGKLNFWIRMKNGERRFIKHQISENLADGEKDLRFMVITDLTDEKLAREALIQSEEKYRLVFDNSPVGIGLTKLDGEVIALNDRIKEMFNVTNPKAGLNVIDYYENSDERAQIISQLKESGEVQNREIKFKKDSGESIVCRITASPFQLSNEMVILTVLEDITEIKKNEEELIKLSTALEQSPTIVVITDLDYQIQYVNPKFTTVTGYSKEEVIGQNPKILQSGNQPETYASLVDKLKLNEEWSGNFHNKKKNGDLFWEAARISPILDKDGNPIYYLKVAVDITEQRRLEDELINAKVRAEESDALKSAFLMNLSHEVRTPLNAILGFTAILQETLPAEEQTNTYFRNIQSAGQDLLKLLEDTIDMAKIENNQVTITRSWRNIKDSMDELYHQFNERFSGGDKKFSFIYNCDPENIPVNTDHELLKKGISCVLDNAFKFTDKGQVSLSIHLNGGNTVEVKIKDTGIGIPADKRDLVFDKFVKFERDDKLFRGNGLGLSIADWLIRSLGGKIELQSEVNEGSEFTVVIPLSAD